MDVSIPATLRRRSANTRAAAGQRRRPGGEKGSQCGGRQTNDTVIELIIPTGRCLQYCPLSGNTEIHWEHGHRHHQPHCPPHSLPHHSRAGCILIWPKGKIRPPKLLKLNQVDLNIAIFENLFAERSHKQLRAFTVIDRKVKAESCQITQSTCIFGFRTGSLL